MTSNLNTPPRKSLTLVSVFGSGYKPKTYRRGLIHVDILLNQFEGTERLILDQIVYTTEWLVQTGRLAGHVEQSLNRIDFKKYFKLIVLPTYKEAVKNNWYSSGDMHQFVKQLLISLP